MPGKKKKDGKARRKSRWVLDVLCAAALPGWFYIWGKGLEENLRLGAESGFGVRTCFHLIVIGFNLLAGVVLVLSFAVQLIELICRVFHIERKKRKRKPIEAEKLEEII